MYDRVLKAKTVSYGLIEVRQSGYYYSIYVNNEIKETSTDLTFILNLFDTKYY